MIRILESVYLSAYLETVQSLTAPRLKTLGFCSALLASMIPLARRKAKLRDHVLDCSSSDGECINVGHPILDPSQHQVDRRSVTFACCFCL